MKKENTRRKKKIAKYFLLMLLLEIAFALLYVFTTYKSICELNVTDNTIMLRFYSGVFVSLGVLLVTLIIATVLYVKVISCNEK